MFPPIHNSISINAPVSRIWAMLTDPVLMKAWMSEMDLDIDTDWNVGSPVVITGTIYKKPFFNKGTVLSYLPEQELAYTHLSSLSRLPDVPESYTKLSFKLSSDTDGTILDIHIENFPTEAIYRHLQFYWNVVPHILKRIAEQ